MSNFGPPRPDQERQNRKILEGLNEKKKLLQMQAAQAGFVISRRGSGPSNPAPLPGASLPVGLESSSQQQRAAMQHAQSVSPGYFIPQDSSFGNLILPVIPRLDAKPRLDPRLDPKPS